jgi:hypothetical protein
MHDEPFHCLCNSNTQYITARQVLRRRADAGSQPADVWAAGVLLWALVGGGFPFLKPEEEALGRAGRIRAMAPGIVLGCTRPLPDTVR